MNILHFSLGPVQGFVAQARRTRDLWAGSFLLSWLAGQAMRAVIGGDGHIVFPAVQQDGQISDPLLAAILGKPLGEAPCPAVGSLPNRFKARVPEGFDPELCRREIKTRWQQLADAVWEQYVAKLAGNGHGNDTYAIWQRQIGCFWEVHWVVAPDPGDGSDGAWLDTRKNWRSHWPTEEPGDHCSVMGDYQELSGWVSGRGECKKQRAFWNALQQQIGRLDLRDGEKLCVISLVKRLFPKLSRDVLEQTIGWVPGGNLQAVGNWPSTLYMSAVPWLRQVRQDQPWALKSYRDTVRNCLRGDFHHVCSEWATAIQGLEPADADLGEALQLDGNLFFETALANPRATPLSSRVRTEENSDTDVREALLSALKTLYGAAKTCPQPFYALLLLDGDRLGKLLRDHNPGAVSLALLTFTRQAPRTVHAHDGVTVYAGGDDVLALLPVDRALACSRQLRADYADAFQQKGLEDTEATASSAIIYAHYLLPMSAVLREAHHRLDNVAKEANGRDSLALALFKGEGVTAQWVNTWYCTDGSKPAAQLQALVEGMKRFPRGFFHKLRKRLGALAADSKGEESGMDLDDDLLRELLVAEYMASREREVKREEAEQAIKILRPVLQSWHRRDNVCKQRRGLAMDGAFLARFLADGGSEPL